MSYTMEQGVSSGSNGSTEQISDSAITANAVTFFIIQLKKLLSNRLLWTQTRDLLSLPPVKKKENLSASGQPFESSTKCKAYSRSHDDLLNTMGLNAISNATLHIIDDTGTSSRYKPDIATLIHGLISHCNRYDDVFVNATEIEQGSPVNDRLYSYFPNFDTLSDNLWSDNNHLRLLHIKGVRQCPDRDANTVHLVLALVQFTIDPLDASCIKSMNIFINKANYEKSLEDDFRKGDAHHFIQLAAHNVGDLSSTLAMCNEDCHVYKYDTISHPRSESAVPSVTVPMAKWLEYMRLCRSMYDTYCEDASYETVSMTSELTRIRGHLTYQYLGKKPFNMDIIAEGEPSFSILPNDGIERKIDYPFEYDIYYDITGRISRFEIHRDLPTLLSCYKTDTDIVSKTINEAVIALTEKNDEGMAEQIYAALEKLIEKERLEDTMLRVSDRLEEATTLNRDETTKLLGSYLAQIVSK